MTDVRIFTLVIAAIGAVAYIPLFVVLLSNRPLDRKQRSFLLFLIAVILWSLVGFVGSSNLFGLGREPLTLLARIALCLVMWMVVQLHYFICSFYQSERIKVPLAYIFLVATIVLAASGRAPRGVTESGVIVYGPEIIAVGVLFLFVVGSKDIYSLVQKYRLSPSPVERNQIIYLIAAIGIFTVFLLGSTTALGGQFPISIVGNLIVASVLTYAVVTHRLVDMGVVLRQALVHVVVYGTGLGAVLAIFWLAHRFVGFELKFASVAGGMALGMAAILYFGYRVRGFWERKVEEAFVGEKSFYRRQLAEFIGKVHDVAGLEQMGKEFIALVGQSLDCRRACLLLPEVEDGKFSAQFVYPPAEENPMRGMQLRQDSPIVGWLRKKGSVLATRNIDILPEFQSVWQEEREEIELCGVKMFVPLLNRGKLVGVLAVAEKRDGKLYMVEDIDLLESIAAKVAGSMEKEYFHERLREQDEEVNLINRLTAIITSSTSLEKIFDDFAEELKKVVAIDWATIALIDGSELHFVALSSSVGSAWQTGEKIPLEGTATEFACREGQAVYEPDLKRHHRFWTWESHVRQGIRSVVCLPLIVVGRPIGSLILASRTPNAYNQRQIKLLERVVFQIAAPIENAQLYVRLEQKSRMDALTGLFNRRHFEERLKEEVSRHSRYSGVFSVLMLDLDNFKSYNDRYGHPAGDIVLAEVGKIIRNSIRNADQAFRYGGDEFVVILPETGRDDAYVVAERIRERVAGEMEKGGIGVTCSIGLASYPGDGAAGDELVDAADNALYYAKRAGANRVFSWFKLSSWPLEEGGFERGATV